MSPHRTSLSAAVVLVLALAIAGTASAVPKSFGICDAHDQNYLDPGQLASFGLIFGR